MLDQVLDVFRVVPDYDLNSMTPGQTLASSAARILAALEPVMADAKPDIVFVQGDTTTTLCGALARFTRAFRSATSKPDCAPEIWRSRFPKK